VAFLMIGLLAFCHMLTSDCFGSKYVLAACIFSLLSIVFVNYSVIPLTEPIFFGVSMCCLATMKSVLSHLTFGKLMISVALVMASICIRRIGIALVPSFLWMVISHPGVRLYGMRLTARVKAVCIVSVIFIATAGTWIIYSTSTLRDYGKLSIHTIEFSLTAHLTELGEIALNMLSGRLPPVLRSTVPVLGVVVVSLMLLGMLGRGFRSFGVVEVYFVSYVVITLVWPYYDIRFWLPVEPLLMAYCGLSVKRLIQRHEILKYSCAVYMSLFVMVGLLVITVTTSVTFAGSGFADSYPDASYHSTNCLVWHCNESDSTPASRDGLHLLRYYGQNETRQGMHEK